MALAFVGKIRRFCVDSSDLPTDWISLPSPPIVPQEIDRDEIVASDASKKRFFISAAT